MVEADLHVHTQNSDGVLTLDEVPAASHRAGLSAVAITDHDRLHPDLDAPVSERDGLDLIHGIELRVDAGQRLDLLGYGVEPTPALRDEIARLQQDRVDRGAEIIRQLETRLEIEIDLEPQPGIGRPHIARAVADHPETTFDVQGVFDELIGDGRPCYVARDLRSFGEGRRLLDAACRVVGLAHPFRYDDPVEAIELASELDAIERWYPYERAVDPDAIEEAIDEHALLATGGSDTHTTEVGTTGMPATAYAAVRDQLYP